MPALSFKKSFAYKILNRTKRQTIRNIRKQPIEAGDRLYLYCGQRTKYCVKLGEADCDGVNKITIRAKSVTIGKSIKITELHKLNVFAKFDGFKSWEEMKRWWKITHGPKCFPFKGIIIYWINFKPEIKMKQRLGKAKGFTKHLGKSVGSSRNRNLKRINNKAIRNKAKRNLSE